MIVRGPAFEMPRDFWLQWQTAFAAGREFA